MICNFYDSSNIKVLKGLDAVRKRPGMYIGDTYDGSGLHHMVFEVVDNSVDEALAGFCKNIIVTLHKDNSVSVLDDGRGIPTDIHDDLGISGAELVMTILHSGGKFNNDSYNFSGGLHGVGISVVNALSEKLELKIYRNKKVFHQIYFLGIPENKLSIIGDTDLNGTYIRFWPDRNIFYGNIDFKLNILFKRLNELSYLNSFLKINLVDKRSNINLNINNKGGIKSFLNYLVGKKKSIHKNIFYLDFKKKKFILSVACKWIDSSKNNIICFTNNIPQHDGGTHLIGFKSAITRTTNIYLDQEINKRRVKFNVNGEDTRVGLFAIISIRIPNPKFSSQTKEKLISSEVKFLVKSLVSEYLLDFFLKNLNDTKNIMNKIINSFKIRESAKKARELLKKKNNLWLSSIASKLADCQEKNPKLKEIFLVEGDSAGGSAKQGRNRLNQAILPLKGKIINVEKTNLDKILSSKEINTLISVLGCGIINNNFNLSKLRYHNIIIMTDADVDGAHIRTLLLTFFYRYMPDLINQGYLYIAHPPLYKIKKKNIEFYVNHEYDLFKYKIFFSFKNIILYKDKKNILLCNNDLMNISLEYVKILDLFSLDKSKFYVYLFNRLMFFRIISINSLLDIKLWINDFLLILNDNLFFKNKIFCKLIKKDGVFLKFKFIYVNNFINEVIYIDKFFFLNKYLNFTNLSKKIYFFNFSYKKYILLNNVKKYFKDFYSLIVFLLEKYKDNIFIQRYKGLGEMNPNQLWDTTMNPKNRVISKILIKDAVKADKLFKILMGDDVKSRRYFIENNSINFKDIDI